MKTQKLNHLLWKKRKLLAAILVVIMAGISIFGLSTAATHTANPRVKYEPQISSIGWQSIDLDSPRGTIGKTSTGCDIHIKKSDSTNDITSQTSTTPN